MLCWMSKIVDAVEAWYKQHGTPRVAPPHRPENTSQGIASSGHTWMHVPQRSRMATEKREPLSAQNRPCWQALYQSRPPRSSAQEKRARGRSRCGSAGLERFWSGTLVGSLNFVNAAGLRPQDSAFVGLSNFPSFDRNHADEELGKLRFGLFQHRGTHHIDTQSLRKLNCGSPNKSFQRARNGCTRDTGEDRVVIENARNQGEGSP